MSARPAASPELTTRVAAAAADHEVPGLAVAVVTGDDTLIATSGVTSTVNPLPVTPETLFFIGSTTKTLTATAVVAQVEAGRVQLDDAVRTHVPDFRLPDEDAAEAMTVRMLLNHTGGWRGDSVPDTGWGDDALERALREDVAKEPQTFHPGEHVSYNNSAYLVAGRLLEHVHGTTYEAAVRSSVLEPLGMSETGFLPWEVAHRRHAVGHAVTTGAASPIEGWPLTRATGPAGGAVSSLSDQVRYLRFHLEGTSAGRPPVSNETRQLMQQLTAPARSVIDGVGLSWLLQTRGRTRLVTHGGNVSNLHLSTFVLAPDERFGVTVLGNSKGAGAAGRELVDWAFEHFLGQRVPPPLPPLPLSDELAAGYVGRYDAGAWFLDIAHAAGQLTVQMVLPDGVDPEIRRLFETPPQPLVLVGADQVAVTERPHEIAGDFGRGGDGAVRWLRWGMRLAMRVAQ